MLCAVSTKDIVTITALVCGFIILFGSVIYAYATGPILTLPTL